MKHWWTISMVNVPEFTVALFFYVAPHSIQSGVFKCTKHVKMDVLSEDGCPQSSVCSEVGLLWKSKSEVFSFWTEDAENRKSSFRSMLRKKHTNSIRTYRYYCYDTSWESNRWFICCKARTNQFPTMLLYLDQLIPLVGHNSPLWLCSTELISCSSITIFIQIPMC